MNATTMQREQPKTHAAIRAMERYGVELTLEDIRWFARRCLKDEGLLETQADGAQRHTLIHDGRVLWVVYRPPGEGRPKDGIVVTITPPSANTSIRTTIADMKQKWRRINGRRGSRPRH